MGVHSSRSLPHSLHSGRGVQTQAWHSWQRCMTSFCCAAASQNGFASVVTAGKGFFSVASGMFVLRFVSQDSYRAATEILAIGKNTESAYQSRFRIRYLALAAFIAQLSHSFDDVQCAAGGRRLPTVDHAAACLDRQLTFERKIRSFVKTHITLSTEAEVFDLQVNDDDIVVVELQKINVAVLYPSHVHRHF